MAAPQDLRLYDSTPAEVPSLVAVETIPGLRVLAAAGLNGPGKGQLASAANKASLTWQPPGEAAPGAAVTCPTDGTYTLTFGDKWLQVAILRDWMDAGGAFGPVYLQDLYNNGLASDDVTAAEALAGDVETYSLNLKNAGTDTLQMLRGWLDAETEFLEISNDNATWNSGTSYATGLWLGIVDLTATIDLDTLTWDDFDTLTWHDWDVLRWSLDDDWTTQVGYESLTWEEWDALTWEGWDTMHWRCPVPSRMLAGETSPIYFRRTIPAETEAHPYVRNHIHVAIAATQHSFRGLYRVFNAAEFRLYRSLGGVPAESGTPYATSPTLPVTPAATFTDGDWRLSMCWFDGVLSSGFYPVGPSGETYLRLRIVDGVLQGPPPLGPMGFQLFPLAGGVVRIVGTYQQAAPWRADDWAVAYTINGTTPAEDDPDLTEEIPTGAVSVLDYSLPAQAHGVTVKVRLQTRRNDAPEPTEENPDPDPIWVYSEASEVLSLLIVTSGPTAALGGAQYRGELPQGA